jgi:hypothetical protein
VTSAAVAPDHPSPPDRPDGTAVTEAGVYGGMPAEVYHRDPVPGGSLSSTGLRKLTPPNVPAVFKEWRENPPLPTAAFNFGHGAHKVVLGEGAELVTFPKVDGRTREGKAVRAEMNAALAEGLIVLDEDEYATVQAMAAKLQTHRLAMALLSAGEPEQAMFWQDPETGIWCRSMVDKLRPVRNGRLTLVDYKTADSAHPDKFCRKGWDYGYPQQDDHYSTGARVLGLAEIVDFAFVVQEKTPPYLVNVVQFNDADRQRARNLNREAIDTYVRCTESQVWPGYGDPDDAQYWQGLGDAKAIVMETPSYIEYRYPLEGAA